MEIRPKSVRNWNNIYKIVKLNITQPEKDEKGNAFVKIRDCIGRYRNGVRAKVSLPFGRIYLTGRKNPKGQIIDYARDAKFYAKPTGILDLPEVSCLQEAWRAGREAVHGLVYPRMEAFLTKEEVVDLKKEVAYNEVKEMMAEAGSY